MDARQVHVRCVHDQPAAGIDDAGHGDADGGQVIGRDAPFLHGVVHALFQGGDGSLGAFIARRGPFFAGDNLARLADQRRLHLRAADVHAQVKPMLIFPLVLFHGWNSLCRQSTPNVFLESRVGPAQRASHHE